MELKREKLLDRLYKDVHSPVCFTSVEPLLREARRHDKQITRAQVKEYLARQSVYTLHRRAVRRYRRLHTLAPGLHTEWQADLAVMDRLARDNRGYKYFLVCIDTLSRQLFVEPVKSKHSHNMIAAFKRLFARAHYVPWKLLTDAGLEFRAGPVQAFFHSLQMEHFTMQTSPQFHAGMAERANRSIKERLYRLFTERRTQKWVDVIQHIVSALNNSPNSSIFGMRPVDVTFENAETLRKALQQKALDEEEAHARPHRFKPGDRVRIEKHKHVFQKGYLPNFTSEIFIVDRVRHSAPYQPITYGLRDQQGEPIRGWFYANDLCRVGTNEHDHDDDDDGDDLQRLYKIEKVLKRRKREGQEFVFVKWKGYGNRYNSWIPISTIKYT